MNEINNFEEFQKNLIHYISNYIDTFHKEKFFSFNVYK